MMLRKLARKLIMTSIAAGLCSVSFSALANNCALGENCLVPNSQGMTTTYTITPKTGTAYVCDVNTKEENFMFLVTGGGRFVMTHGFGPHIANPHNKFYISGFFLFPNEKTTGSINLTQLSPHAGANVVCNVL